jgi:hypothetical protein
LIVGIYMVSLEISLMQYINIHSFLIDMPWTGL